MKIPHLFLSCFVLSLPFCDAGTDCDSPAPHGADCTHTRRNPNRKSCGTGGSVCDGTPIYTCIATTYVLYNIVPDGCVPCATTKRGDQDCWATHTNCDQVNGLCSQTYRCTWDEIGKKCVSDPNTGSAWTQGLIPTHYNCQ